MASTFPEEPGRARTAQTSRDPGQRPDALNNTTKEKKEIYIGENNERKSCDQKRQTDKSIKLVLWSTTF